MPEVLHGRPAPAAGRRGPWTKRRRLPRAAAALAPAPAGIDERAVVLLQRVRERVVDARLAEALVLPQRDDEQLAAGAGVPGGEEDGAGEQGERGGPGGLPGPLVLPQRGGEQLAAGAVVPADEDDVAVDEVADVDRAARR